MLGRVMKFFSSGGVKKPKEEKPIVSIIVIVYDMVEQAKKTIISLCVDYQQGVDESDYEVIIVENESSHLMDKGFINTLPRNVHYYCRKETQPTPVYAIDFGVLKTKGRNICLMIDGARMLTPGVIRNIILGHNLFNKSVVSIPGYHLGNVLQQEAVNGGYGEETERALLDSINWPSGGYQLFDIACFSGSSRPGFFLPNYESNCISMPRDVWEALGGCDSRFDLRGGGFINLDLYKRACESLGVEHVIIPGEGTFHQFHGGVTTGGEEKQVREEYINASSEQYIKLRGQEYRGPDSKPVYLGTIPDQAQRFLHYSSEKIMKTKGLIRQEVTI